MTAVAIALLAWLGAGASTAQDMSGHDHSKMTMQMSDAPSTKAFQAADAKMHDNMGVSYSGDPDVDFVRGMIPHHQGAIDMAKVELEYGKNPDIRKIAETIIAAQEGEIAALQAWLDAHAN
jgi:uncharacterized protein (DUF305 family)